MANNTNWTMTEIMFLIEIYYYEFHNKRFSFHTQNILKNQHFFHIITRLEDKGLINILKDRSRRYYKLTDRGRMMANEFCKDNLAMKYRMMGTRRYIEWESGD